MFNNFFCSSTLAFSFSSIILEYSISNITNDKIHDTKQKK